MKTMARGVAAGVLAAALALSGGMAASAATAAGADLGESGTIRSAMFPECWGSFQRTTHDGNHEWAIGVGCDPLGLAAGDKVRNVVTFQESGGAPFTVKTPWLEKAPGEVAITVVTNAKIVGSYVEHALPN